MARFGSPAALAWLCSHGAHTDSVELKALLSCAAGPAAEALTGRTAPSWSVRQTYLLDTGSLELLRAGIEVRLRRRARGRYDLAVAAHRTGGAPARATPPGVRVELDVVPGALWQDLEVRNEVDPAAAAAVVAGTAASRELLSPAQWAWACRGGDRTVDEDRLGDLRVHGPLDVSRVKVAATGLGLRRADLEHFRFPSGRELLELSTHCGPRDVSATATAFERLLDERGVPIAPDYRTRTSVWRDELSGGATGRPGRPG